MVPVAIAQGNGPLQESSGQVFQQAVVVTCVGIWDIEDSL